MQAPNPQELHEVIPGTIVAGVISFVGTIISVIVTWTKDRSLDARCVQIIELATKYTLFWDQQYRVAAGDDSDVDRRKKEAISHINSAATFLTARLEHLQHRVETKSLPASRFRRWFLLYKPSRRFTWMARAFFYVYAFGGIVVAARFIFLGSVEFLPGKVLAVILYPILTYLFALPFRLLSEWYDRRVTPNILLATLLRSANSKA